MRIYKNCFEMHSEVRRDLHEMGTLVHTETMQDKRIADDDDYRTLELSPYAFQILGGQDRDEWIESLGLSLEWCREDFMERISSYGDPSCPTHNPGEAWKLREVWDEFVHDGKFAYTYSERFGLNHTLTRMMEELKQDPNTRHGILPVYNASIDSYRLDGSMRIPCSMHYQFMRRDNALQGMYVMRSCDLITHFPYDIWHALELQRFVAGAEGISIPTGRFTFFTGSLHIYAKDADEGVF